MFYRGKVDYAQQRKIRERNTRLYRIAHWPIWIWVYFITPGPLTFRLFARGFSRSNVFWLTCVMVGTGVAGLRGSLPGVEPRPYILRFDEDKPNPLYRRVCYTFAWNAAANFALLNMIGLLVAAFTGTWYMKRIYQYGYAPIFALILLLGITGRLPRVGPSTRGEGVERRYFYGSVWSITIAQMLLLISWRVLPPTHIAAVAKLAIYAGTLMALGAAAQGGSLPRTRPILSGEWIVIE